jgi:GDPmannose 4,6-dehydratase
MIDALILGVNGQDGSYLAEELLRRGYSVAGIARQPESRWVRNASLQYVTLNVANAPLLDQALAWLQPRCIYHVAAVHGAAGHYYEEAWQDALAVNVGSVHVCLEHMRLRAPAAGLFYASSLKAFGEPPPAEITETTPGRSTCLYGITKNAAGDLIRHYRRTHGIRAAIGFFFNHDSPRRPDSYFLPRLARHMIARAVGGPPAPGVATLDFWCDWGSAVEYMQLVVDVMSRETPLDAVFATGRPIHASEIAEYLASRLGVPAPHVSRTVMQPLVQASLDGLRTAAGRLPEVGALEVAGAILEDRLERSARRQQH